VWKLSRKKLPNANVLRSLSSVLRPEVTSWANGRSGKEGLGGARLGFQGWARLSPLGTVCGRSDTGRLGPSLRRLVVWRETVGNCRVWRAGFLSGITILDLGISNAVLRGHNKELRAHEMKTQRTRSREIVASAPHANGGVIEPS
jgi:hypothetical protein